MRNKTATGSRKRWYTTWRIGCIIAVVGLFACGGNRPPLEPWHSENLTEEYSSDKSDEIQTFDDYRQLEDKLFAQLEDKVYARTETGLDYALVRYSSGSAADPELRKPNWNHSFELPTDEPVGGVLLLHGMSDSPYTFRALGEALNKHNYWVIGPRFPGHGTAPSGLRNITWEDMASVVQLSVEHLASKVGRKPIHIVGFSTGAALALNFTLDALEGNLSPVPSSLVMISPAIGIHPLAGLAALKNGLSYIPGLGRMAWLSIQPEFDPYKYNSFATNAGTQVHRVTRSVARRIGRLSNSGAAKTFPPTLVFLSTVDATVTARAVVESLLRPLGPHGQELVLFDINRFVANDLLTINDPGPLTTKLMADETLPFAITFVTNENPESIQVVARHKDPFSPVAPELDLLGIAWPTGVISLSHVALPFPPDDPLYGRRPPDDEGILFLGQMAIQGERGLLKIPFDWLVRLRHNPFYEYLESRAVAWMKRAGENQPAVGETGN